MPEKIITIYCFFDELLTSLKHKDGPQSLLSDAEIMTVATGAARLFHSYGDTSGIREEGSNLGYT